MAAHFLRGGRFVGCFGPCDGKKDGVAVRISPSSEFRYCFAMRARCLGSHIICLVLSVLGSSIYITVYIVSRMIFPFPSLANCFGRLVLFVLIIVVLGLIGWSQGYGAAPKTRYLSLSPIKVKAGFLLLARSPLFSVYGSF